MMMHQQGTVKNEKMPCEWPGIHSHGGGVRLADLAGGGVFREVLHGDEAMHDVHEGAPVGREARQVHDVRQHEAQKGRPAAEGLVEGV